MRQTPSNVLQQTDWAADTVDEFCQALRIGRTLFYAEVATGRIKPRKAGKRTIIPRTEREAWLDRLQAMSTDSAGR